MKFREYLKTNEEVSVDSTGIKPYDTWGGKDDTSQTKKKAEETDEEE